MDEKEHKEHKKGRAEGRGGYREKAVKNEGNFKSVERSFVLAKHNY